LGCGTTGTLENRQALLLDRPPDRNTEEVFMKAKAIRLWLVAAVLVTLAPLAVPAAGESVGLGVAIGMAFPQGDTAKIASTDWQPSLNWGFYVNIPIISTLHLTPSSELYKFDSQSATDMSLAFKFIVPLSRFDLYAGFVPGLTAVGSVVAPHVGILGGFAMPLVSNLDLFVQGKYKWVFQGAENLRVFHMNAGVLFNF
jgi:hypothetical protein